jgi:hypothetical protein
MFESLAAQGRSMVKCLEAERDLTPSEQDALPPHERVPIREAVDWQQRVESRIAEACDEDTQARLALILDMHRGDLRASNDGYTPTITAWRRIVDLLDELDTSMRGSAEPPGKSPADDP